MQPNRVGARPTDVGYVRRESVATGNARREFGFVLLLAVAGIAVVLVVAFAPWYGAVAPA